MEADSRLRRAHRALGLAMLLAFVASGAYLKFVAHPDRLDGGAHLLFVSRHMYLLANALAHLSLAPYVVARSTAGTRRLQWIGSGLLAVSSALLLGAFVVEPIAGRSRTAVSSFGWYTLLAGVILHYLATERAPRT